MLSYISLKIYTNFGTLPIPYRNNRQKSKITALSERPGSFSYSFLSKISLVIVIFFQNIVIRQNPPEIRRIFSFFPVIKYIIKYILHNVNTRNNYSYHSNNNRYCICSISFDILSNSICY